MAMDYERPDWQKQAACAGMDINMFFPRRGETKKAVQAKRICLKCPVVDECREYGLALAQEFETVGIFGGLTALNRAQVLHEQGIKVVYRQSYTSYQN
jgi:WhiB family redox-sensing transcriptional regulator